MNSRKRERAEGYNPFDRACPSRELLSAVTDKWTVLILLTLEEGPRRYTRIAQAVDGISEKMLSQRLREMTETGLIARWAYERIPPRVDYELTDLGRSLLPVAKALVGWATDHAGDVGRRSQPTGT